MPPLSLAPACWRITMRERAPALQMSDLISDSRFPTSKMPDWPHSPMHRSFHAGAYIVTGATYLKRPLFRGADRLNYLCQTLSEHAVSSGWQLQAWAVFPNHYHFVALSAEGVQGAAAGSSPPNRSLSHVIRRFHSATAIQANKCDATPGRRVWFQFWDTQLTFEESYLARLSYVHKNAVHHGLVREASLYPWCSAGWFQLHAPKAFCKTVMGMKVDQVRVSDDYPVDACDV